MNGRGGDFLIVETHEKVARDAAELAIEHQLKGGDAIILASAIMTKSVALLSWDPDLTKLGTVGDLLVREPTDFRDQEDLLDLIPRG